MRKYLKKILSVVVVFSMLATSTGVKVDASSTIKNPYICKVSDRSLFFKHRGVSYRFAGNVKPIQVSFDKYYYNVKNKSGKINDKSLKASNLTGYQYEDPAGRTIDCAFASPKKAVVFPEIPFSNTYSAKKTKVMGKATYTGKLTIMLNGYKGAKNYKATLDITKGKKFRVTFPVSGFNVEEIEFIRKSDKPYYNQYWTYRVTEKHDVCSINNRKNNFAFTYVYVWAS